MKIGISPDWHIDNSRGTYLVEGRISNREQDMDKQVDSMLSACQKRKVETFYIPGDLFDKTSINAYWFHRATTYLKRFTDAGIHVVIIPGNHEISESGLPLTNVLRDLENDLISVYNQVGSIGEGIFVIPHVCRNTFKDYPTFSDYIREQWKKRLRSKHGTTVIGHFEPKGSLPGAEREMFAGSSRIIDTRIFGESTVFSGHIHTPQKLKNTYIVGSPVRFSLSECKDNKRFIIYDTKTRKVESIVLDCQNMRKVRIDFIKKDSIDFLPDKMKRYKSAIVGIFVDTSKANRVKIISRDIIAAFTDSGAHVIRYVINTIKEDSLETKKGNKASMTPTSLFTRKTKEIVKSESRRPAILKLGNEILEDSND